MDSVFYVAKKEVVLMGSDVREMCDAIRQIAYELHLYLGVGYLEKVYENGLVHRLKKHGFEVKTQVPITVHDEDGFVLGEYVADIVVNDVIIELKSVSTLLPAHVAQLMNYPKATNTKHGMLINFGSEKFQCRKLAF